MSFKLVQQLQEKAVAAEQACCVLDMSAARAITRFVAAASSASASAAHLALLAKHGLIGSMSLKGRCWDNAVIKRLFLSLKMERVWQNDYANHAKATNDIADYIVSFYNSVRLRSALGNVPPNAFEHQASSGNHITYRRVRNNLTRTCRRGVLRTP